MQALEAAARGPDEHAGGRVAINARAAIRPQIGGVERLAREMAARLPLLDPGRYRVIRPPRAFATWPGHAWEQAVLPARAAGCALIYSPANLAPALSGRNAVVIHDAAPLRHPESFSRAYVAYQRIMLRALARRARLVITVSEFSRNELVELLGIAAQRTAVIPEGVSERFNPGAPRSAGDSEPPYVLAVGTASARKNLEILSRARAALAERGVEIVVAGAGRHYLRGGEAPLRRLGYVTEEELPGLYAGALAVVMPSRYEGFGLPCLEAMACGVPVVAADSAALPETVGDAGLLAPPDDGDAFAQALEAACFDQPLRTQLIERGLRRAAAFTWERTAELTDGAIEELLAGRLVHSA